MSDKLLKYKSYFGSIEVDLGSNTIFGKILFINDLITYESSELSNIQREFESSIDNYSKTGKALGRDPNKTFTGTFNVRLGPDLHRDASIFPFVSFRRTRISRIIRITEGYKNRL